MFTHLGVRNFKALDDFQMDLMPLTVLIGENSCGKSTVLQVLDLLGNIATRDIGEYFEDRQWTYAEVRSQRADSAGAISFDLDDRCADGSVLSWSISMELVEVDGTEEWHVRESITDKATGELLLGYGVPDTQGSHIGGPNLLVAHHNGRRSEPVLVKLSSSALKVIDAYANERWMDLDPRLFELRRELSSTCAAAALGEVAWEIIAGTRSAREVRESLLRRCESVHSVSKGPLERFRGVPRGREGRWPRVDEIVRSRRLPQRLRRGAFRSTVSRGQGDLVTGSRSWPPLPAARPQPHDRELGLWRQVGWAGRGVNCYMTRIPPVHSIAPPISFQPVPSFPPSL